MLIAARKLAVRSEGLELTLEVRLFKPVSEDGAWSCQYEIDWPDGTKKGRAVGVDGIQAILVTLQKIGILLYTSKYHENAQLVWPAAESGYGFPVPSNTRDLLMGEDVEM
ncbi:hypothetical protein [Dongia sp.]|uniref:DUF6968 family protein n=1 Tax=Dongia sp. TaxID=1977262 RepID=UPI0035AE0566